MLLLALACTPAPRDTGTPSDPPPTDTGPVADTDPPTPPGDTDPDTDTDVEDTAPDPMAYDPAGDGPFAFTDERTNAGPRPARVYVPDRADPAPVVVLLHGFLLAPIQYDSYAARLATRGYAVVLPEMSGSAIFPSTFLLDA